MGRHDAGAQIIPLGVLGDMLGQPSPAFQILMSSTYETDTFSDAASHDMAIVEIQEGRSSMAKFTLTVHDDVNSRTAQSTTEIGLVRFGAGTLGLEGTLVVSSFDPNFGPWNTITASAVVVDASHVGVRVAGLLNVPIRWSIWMGIYGNQARLSV